MEENARESVGKITHFGGCYCCQIRPACERKKWVILRMWDIPRDRYACKHEESRVIGIRLANWSMKKGASHVTGHSAPTFSHAQPDNADNYVVYLCLCLSELREFAHANGS